MQSQASSTTVLEAHSGSQRIYAGSTCTPRQGGVAAGTPSTAKSEGMHLFSSSVPSGHGDTARNGFNKMLKVPSLVFDLDLEDGGIGEAWHPDGGQWEEEEVVTEIQRFTNPQSPAEARLLSDVKAAMQHTREGQEFARLAQILTALGYRVQVRTALGGGDGADCLRNLRHTFLNVTLVAAPSQQQPHQQHRLYIVDPQFKEQFYIAKTTARYAAILAAVPQVYVGPEEHLELLVNFLCTEMSAAFKQLGSVLPPWRHASSVMSKWQPRKSLDEHVAPAHQQASAVGNATVSGAGTLQQQRWSHLIGNKAHQQADAKAADACGWVLPKPQPLAATSSAAGSGGSNKPSWEPKRVYFGGNFVPITPAHAS